MLKGATNWLVGLSAGQVTAQIPVINIIIEATKKMVAHTSKVSVCSKNKKCRHHWSFGALPSSQTHPWESDLDWTLLTISRAAIHCMLAHVIQGNARDGKPRFMHSMMLGSAHDVALSKVACHPTSRRRSACRNNGAKEIIFGGLHALVGASPPSALPV